MQRTPTKAPDRTHWWWGAAAAMALGLALYGWVLQKAQAESEPQPQSPAQGQEPGPSWQAQPATVVASVALIRPALATSTAAPWAVGAASSSITRQVKALPLALPVGAPAPFVPWGQGVAELLAQRPVDVAGGRTQALVTLRDPSTGQLHYRLSVLRVELKPGADAQALAQSVHSGRLDFSNQDYALIEIEPKQLAAAYRQLQGDARVLGIGLKAYIPPARPK